ncbi:MAG: hypothetical protein AB8B55_03720 [Mariniblastus sp.]
MRTIQNNPWLRSLAVSLLSVSLLMITGCGGCRNDAKKDAVAKKKEEEEKEKKKKEKPKDDFEYNTPVLLPGIYPKPKLSKEEEDKKKKENILQAALDDNSPLVQMNRVKLGHWYTASLQAIANNFNSDGQLTTVSIDGMGKPVVIPKTDYFLKTSRPISLPKGEWKNFETTVFVPNRGKSVLMATINYRIGRGGGLSQVQFSHPSLTLKPHQYHMVLLSSRPDSYKYLQLADAIKLSTQLGSGELTGPFYYLIPSKPEFPLPLPQHSLNWTTIAYLVWDDLDPTTLNPEHQDAILDWLHFGGQLIVSGPDSLDKLQTSFLANYLPAQFDGTLNLTNEDLKELNENWTVPTSKLKAAAREFKISDKVPLLGITFKPHSDANFVEGTGEIAIERQIGRGRIVVTAFSLNSPLVRSWQSFKSFLNGALLRKPARYFNTTMGEETAFEWVDDPASIMDPMINTTVRFMARDLSRSGTEPKPKNVAQSKLDEDLQTPMAGFNYGQVALTPEQEISLKRSQHKTKDRNLDDHWHYGGFQDATESGMGGWNDNSGIAYAARQTLKEAAGITPPSSAFVLKMLAAYLFVLVPLNWLLFRLMGRVEYAWVAAPLIAITGAVVVVKMASLDIGFVRSNTQIGSLEIHAGYSRAHLAEYSALYTSLSTQYNADLDNLTAQSLPFGTVDQDRQFSAKETISEVQLRRTVRNRLEGFQIQSNSTGLVHTEYMLDLNGIVSFTPPTSDEGPSISNSTNIDIRDAAVMGRDASGNYEFAWIGELASKSEIDLTLKPSTIQSLGQPWSGNPMYQNTNRAAEQIWDRNIGEADTATLGTIENFPELSSDWGKFERLLMQYSSEPDHLYVKEDFKRVYQQINSTSKVTLGRMLDTVLKNLTLAPGEYRLIGATDQRLGATKFDPASTQIDQQTLIVAHLKRPPLPLAKRDRNAYEDFARTGRSNLDWENDAKELEELNELDLENEN